MPAKKPTRLLELSGTYRKNPARRRAAEPVPAGPLGDPPGRLPLEARPFWDEIVAMCPDGVLTRADRWSVELSSIFMLKASREPNVAAVLELAAVAELSPRETRALMQSERISSTELATLRSLLAAMGMTPADRSKLSVPTEKQGNRFTDLAAEAVQQSRKPN